MDKRIHLIFSDDGKYVEPSHGESILSALLRHKVEISHSCGGMGTCGTCRIIVENSVETISERNELEQEMANERGFSPAERLACQTHVFADLKIKIP